MSWYLVAISFVMLALGSASAVYYGVLRFRAKRTLRSLPTLRAGLSLPEPAGGWPSICVVVPAHNEEANIEGHAESLLLQDYPGDLRLVWALDRCTDATRERLDAVIAEAPEGAPVVEVVEIETCPDRWAGKVHAVHAGVTVSDGAAGAERLLFADADTWFEPGAVRGSVAMQEERGVDLLSLLCTLTHRASFEVRAQPAAGLELIRRFPLDRVNDPERGLRFANGQFMLFRREAYDAIGGHGAVKDALLEDLQFARLMRHHTHDRSVNVLLADRVVMCRMYATYEEFRRGWKRIYTESAHRSIRDLKRSALRLRITGFALPFASLPVAGWGFGVLLIAKDVPLGAALIGVGVVGRILFLSAMGLVYAMQHAPRQAVRWYPMGAWRVSSILLEAARDLEEGEPTRWGGRSYQREAM
ncbi:MAG: glycosyltransferase [Planctomycetota bacterium]